MSSENNIYLGVYGIYLKDSNVLVIKKGRGPYTGTYDLPGGGLQFRETIEACLEREILEETNAKLLKKTFLSINEYHCQYQKEGELKAFHHVGIYYTVNIDLRALKTEADGEDSLGALFVPVHQLTEKNTSPIALPMILKAVSLL